MSDFSKVKAWHVPLSQGDLTLGEGKASLDALGAEPEDIPLIVQLVENPKFDIPGIEIFNGATDLATHDYIHLLLGRGLMELDEAFVIGFTMGSTNRVSSTEETLFSFFAKHLYPKHYRFGEEALRVFKDAARLGFISRCDRLDKVDYESMTGLTIDQARKKVGLETPLLKAYYEIEQTSYPDIFETKRLLD